MAVVHRLLHLSTLPTASHAPVLAAAQLLLADAGPALLHAADAPPIVWDRVLHDLVLPAYGASPSLRTAAAEAWGRFTASLPAPLDFSARLTQLLHALPVMDQQIHAAADTKDSAQRLEGVLCALASPPGAQPVRRMQPRNTFGAPSAGAPPLPPGPPPALDPLQQELGCKFWNGSEASCFAGPNCPYAASHVPHVPSQLYVRRKPDLLAKGFVEGPTGLTRPSATGGKRPFATAFADPSTASSFPP